MSGGTPDINVNKPTMPTMFALRLRAALWPSVNSASFGMPPAYRHLQVVYTSRWPISHKRSVIPFVTKRIRQRRESADLHSHAEILAFDDGSANTSGIRIVQYCRYLRMD
jgi:hypothetical protein